jgi:hypothetical protein
LKSLLLVNGKNDRSSMGGTNFGFSSFVHACRDLV